MDISSAASETCGIEEVNTDQAGKCAFVIFNPVSGQGDPEQRKQAITEALAQHGYQCQFLATTREQGAKYQAEQALKEKVDLIAVAGGDGTVMEAMSALVGTDIPLAVFPSGTGNLLSVNLGIPMTVPDAVNVALSGRPYALDLAKTDTGQYFAIMGGLGLDARMIADANRRAKRDFGVLAYFWAALKNLPRRHSSYAITLDDNPPIRRRAKMVLIANMGKITGGIEAMPTAAPDDGLLDIGVLRSETLGQWLRLLGYALTGRIEQDPNFDVFQAHRVTVRMPTEQPIEFDGESAGKTKHVHRGKLCRKPFHVLIPDQAPVLHEEEAPIETVKRWSIRHAWVAPVVLVAGLVLFQIKKRRKP